MIVSDSTGIFERDGVLVLPAWLGPAKLMVMQRGRAYTFGIFVLTPDHMAFAARDQVLVNLPRAGIEIEWPKHLAGSGIWVKAPTEKHAICFGKPFVDAPGPNQAAISTSAVALGGLTALGIATQSLFLGAASGGILTEIAVGAVAFKNLKAGRRAGVRVRAALEGKAA